MDEEISQSDLEEELDFWIVEINQAEEINFGKAYLKFWENQGYDVKKYEEELKLIEILTSTPENYINRKHIQN